MQQWIVYRGRWKINLTASILSFYLIFYLVLLVFLKERGENATVDCLSRKAEDPFDGRHFIALLLNYWDQLATRTKSR